MAKWITTAEETTILFTTTTKIIAINNWLIKSDTNFGWSIIIFFKRENYCASWTIRRAPEQDNKDTKITELPRFDQKSKH